MSSIKLSLTLHLMQFAAVITDWWGCQSLVLTNLSMMICVGLVRRNWQGEQGRESSYSWGWDRPAQDRKGCASRFQLPRFTPPSKAAPPSRSQAAYPRSAARQTCPFSRVILRLTPTFSCISGLPSERSAGGQGDRNTARRNLTTSYETLSSDFDVPINSR